MSYVIVDDPRRPGRRLRLGVVPQDPGAAPQLAVGCDGETYVVAATGPSAPPSPGRRRPPDEGAHRAAPDRARPPPQPQASDAAAAGPGPVRAPTAGRIASLAVCAGAHVTPGQLLVVLEAMKVEVPVVAPCAGQVAQVHGQQGAWTDKGAVLLVLRAACAQD